MKLLPAAVIHLLDSGSSLNGVDVSLRMTFQMLDIQPGHYFLIN